MFVFQMKEHSAYHILDLGWAIIYARNAHNLEALMNVLWNDLQTETTQDVLCKTKVLLLGAILGKRTCRKDSEKDKLP